MASLQIFTLTMYLFIDPHIVPERLKAALRNTNCRNQEYEMEVNMIPTWAFMLALCEALQHRVPSGDQIPGFDSHSEVQAESPGSSRASLTEVTHKKCWHVVNS